MANNQATLAVNIATVLGSAVMVVYAGGQPANADSAATAANTALATFTCPTSTSNTVGASGTITVATITDTTWTASGTATWARVTNGANTLFDGSVDTAGADITINVNPVTAGAVAHIAAMTYTVTK